VAADTSWRQLQALGELSGALWSIFKNSAGNQISGLILALFHNRSVA